MEIIAQVEKMSKYKNIKIKGKNVIF